MEAAPGRGLSSRKQRGYGAVWHLESKGSAYPHQEAEQQEGACYCAMLGIQKLWFHNSDTPCGV